MAISSLKAITAADIIESEAIILMKAIVAAEEELVRSAAASWRLSRVQTLGKNGMPEGSVAHLWHPLLPSHTMTMEVRQCWDIHQQLLVQKGINHQH